VADTKLEPGPTTASEHIVQLFDSSDTLARDVARFLEDGHFRGHHLLVIAKPRHWTAIVDRLLLDEFPVKDLLIGGALVVRDADLLLDGFMRRGLPDTYLFQRLVGDLVRALDARGGGRLTIFGEMVEVLAEEGNFDGAQRVEDLWNQLAPTCSFRLLCGYSAPHFAAPGAEQALHAICRSHTLVHATPRDPLASWLLRPSA
jgi:hypothetical protein